MHGAWPAAWPGHVGNLRRSLAARCGNAAAGNTLAWMTTIAFVFLLPAIRFSRTRQKLGGWHPESIQNPLRGDGKCTARRSNHSPSIRENTTTCPPTWHWDRGMPIPTSHLGPKTRKRFFIAHTAARSLVPRRARLVREPRAPRRRAQSCSGPAERPDGRRIPGSAFRGIWPRACPAPLPPPLRHLAPPSGKCRSTYPAAERKGLRSAKHGLSGRPFPSPLRVAKSA